MPAIHRTLYTIILLTLTSRVISQDLSITPTRGFVGSSAALSGDFGHGGDAFIIVDGQVIGETPLSRGRFSVPIRIPPLSLGVHTVELCFVPCLAADSLRASTEFEVIRRDLPPGDFDVQVWAIEVTQGARSDIPTRSPPNAPLILRKSDVVHVAKRRTMVRVYPWVSAAPGTTIPALTATLSAVRATESLPGSPLAPMNRTITVTPGASLEDMRGDWTQSWNFLLPPGWVDLASDRENFSMVLAAQINPDQLVPECSGCDENNSALLPVDFAHVRRSSFRLPLMPLTQAPIVIQPYFVTHECDEGSPVRNTPQWTQFTAALSDMRRLLPVAEGEDGIVVLPVIEEQWDSGDCEGAGEGMDKQDFDSEMLRRHFPGGRRRGDPIGFYRVFFFGGDKFVGGGYAWCGTGHIVSNNGTFTLAHEFGHAIGFDHAGNGHCERVGGNPACDSDYPSSHGEVEANSFGFDFNRLQIQSPGPFSFPPAGWDRDECQSGPTMQRTHDFMAGAAGPTWTSTYTFEKAKRFLSESPPAALRRGGIPIRGDYMLLSGSIDENGQIEIDPLFHTSEPLRDISVPIGKYQLEFRSSAGIVRNRTTLVLDDSNDGEHASFSYAALVPEGWHTLHIRQGRDDVAVRTRSEAIPTVTLTSPRNGAEWGSSGEAVVTWDASDSDGDELISRVEISDDQETWTALSHETTESEARIDLSSIPAGGGEFFVRVQTSDGANAATSNVRRVDLDPRAPQPWILSPKSDAEFKEDAALLLSGSAGDWQDGGIDASRLTWSIDGIEVGSGHQVTVPRLTAGVHQIELRASNSFEIERTTSVTIRVGEVQIGIQSPGDLNQDGRVDISDGIAIFGFLFLGNAGRLPCGDGTVDDDANVALLDFNGDRRVDISDGISTLNWLFVGGRPHDLGLECTPIENCPTACQ
ncbi:MAG: Ig-like domain-containing protein [Planctomycetota bacterium]